MKDRRLYEALVVGGRALVTSHGIPVGYLQVRCTRIIERRAENDEPRRRP